MDSKTELNLLKKLNEFVYDEDKVVTFKWLSKTLDLSVEDSKKLLEKLIINHKKGDLEIIYWVSGKFDDDSYHTFLINQDKFDDECRKFADISCKFIYSIYKKNEVNFKDLLMNSEVRGNIKNALASKRCIKRTLKEKVPLPALKKTDITKQHKSSLFSKVPAKSIKSASDSDVKLPVNNTTAKKENGTVKGIASFISKMPPKQKPQSDICIPISKPDKSESNTKQENTLKINNINKKIQSIIDSDDSEEEKRSPKNTSENQNEKKPKNKRKRNNNNSTVKNKKQRRRIVEPKDSDSDDIFASDNEEEQNQETMHISDEEEELVYKPKPDLGPKNKKRKLVKETFTDDDGYFMTCKKWISVNDESEDEKENTVQEDKKETVDNKTPEVNDTHEAAVKHVIKESSTVANSKPKSNKSKKNVGNQTTLMKFFTKA